MFLKLFAATFFTAQIVWIFVQMPKDTRYCSWAMYSCWGEYNFSVAIDGEELSEEDFLERYGFEIRAFEGRSFAHKFKLIKQYELVRKSQSIDIGLAINGEAYKDFKWYRNAN